MSKSGTFKFSFIFVIGILLGIVVILFILQNADDTPVEFLHWSLTMPLAALIAISVGLGALITFLFSIPGRWRAHRRGRQSSSQVADLENQVKTLTAEIRELRMPEKVNGEQ